jgi:hypothetical protein
MNVKDDITSKCGVDINLNIKEKEKEDEDEKNKNESVDNKIDTLK